MKGDTAILCRCGGLREHETTMFFHERRLVFGMDRLAYTSWVISPSAMPGARTKRRDRRRRHDRPFRVQVFHPPSWSSFTWLR